MSFLQNLLQKVAGIRNVSLRLLLKREKKIKSQTNLLPKLQWQISGNYLLGFGANQIEIMEVSQFPIDDENWPPHSIKQEKGEDLTKVSEIQPPNKT